jgi:hypothetical protein
MLFLCIFADTTTHDDYGTTTTFHADNGGGHHRNAFCDGERTTAHRLDAFL